MTDYNELIKFLEEYSEHFRLLLSFENKKLEILMNNDAAKLNESLSKEQALIMKGNSLESKRISILKGMGFDGFTFKEIIIKAPDEYKTRLESVYNDLTKYIMEIKRVNSSAMADVDIKLDMINKKLKNDDMNTYDEHARKKHVGKASTSISKNI